MLFRSLAKWDEPAKTPALVYFAQILEEMLYEFSLDTYKASVMHTSLLCIEARNTIHEVEAGTIKPPNVHHVTAELAANLERDPVAIALSPLPPSSFTPALRNPKTQARDLEVVLELLSVRLSPRDYRAKTEELLVEAVKDDGNLDLVRRLARSYVTTLTALGFSEQYLLEQTREFFHYGPVRLKSTEALIDFLGLFPADPEKYTVVFRVDPIFEHVAPAFEPIRLKISKSLPPEIDISGFPDVHLPPSPDLYATISGVSARDPYGARGIAERILGLTATLMTLFHHRERPVWKNECVVISEKSGAKRQVSMPMNPMHKCEDMSKSAASLRLKLFTTDFSLNEESFTKFHRSAQLHALAVASNADENQLLNLWIALESLVPSETKADAASNIEHIVSSVVPFLNYGYMERLANQLVKDLLNWNQGLTRKSFRGVPGTKFADKLVRILALEKYEDRRLLLEGAFKDFHLLRDRFAYFRAVFGSPQSVIAALDAHKQRLEWQIRRIYRARNIIVHSGETPAYTKAIIEHTHDYLDTVLELLVRLASRPKCINSVGQGFKFVDLRYSKYCAALHSKGLIFDEANIDSFVFCR